MTYSTRLLLSAVFAAALLACGDDGRPTSDSSITVDSGGTDGGGTDGGGADGGGTDGGGTDGGGTDGGETDGGGADAAVADANAGDAATGCVETGCPGDLMCCSGVPYPAEGVCMEMCTMRSDRDAKERFETIDGDAVLARLAELPITEWSYRDEAREVRHLGPMAQDFHASFGLGADDRSIHPVDATGVTIAAIQALTRRVEDLERDNAALRAHGAALEAELRTRR